MYTWYNLEARIKYTGGENLNVKFACNARGIELTILHVVVFSTRSEFQCAT